MELYHSCVVSIYLYNVYFQVRGYFLVTFLKKNVIYWINAHNYSNGHSCETSFFNFFSHFLLVLCFDSFICVWSILLSYRRSKSSFHSCKFHSRKFSCQSTCFFKRFRFANKLLNLIFYAVSFLFHIKKWKINVFYLSFSTTAYVFNFVISNDNCRRKNSDIVI